MSTQLRMAKSNPKISVVIPARNEARNLETVLPELPAVHEVILVDGNSSDGTIETALRLMPGIKVIKQTRSGKGNALVCGFRAATGDIIVMFDADGSANPAEIPRYVQALVRGADFAKGSRFHGNGGSEDLTLYRATGNKFLNVLTNLLLKTSYTDLCYGYNAFWTDILQHIDLPDPEIKVSNASGMMWGDGFEIETVLNCRIAAARLNVVEVPSVERSRIHGESNLNAIRDGFRVLKTILEEKHTERAMRRDLQAIRKLEETAVARRTARVATVDAHDEVEEEIA
jgi:glycosyltransferase involved in cell wall biosynthesis